MNRCVYSQLLICLTKPSRNQHCIITLETCSVELQGCTLDSERSVGSEDKTE